jgi:hypothetical protein
MMNPLLMVLCIIQIFILVIHFFLNTLTDSLFYSLFSLNIILSGKECDRKREREREIVKKEKGETKK